MRENIKRMIDHLASEIERLEEENHRLEEENRRLCCERNPPLLDDGPCECPDIFPYNVEISKTELSTRVKNSCRRAGLLTMGDLVLRKKECLIAMRGFGRKMVDEIQSYLKIHNLSMGMFKHPFSYGDCSFCSFWKHWEHKCRFDKEEL